MAPFNLSQNDYSLDPMGENESGVSVWLWASVLPTLLVIYWLTASVIVATLIPSVLAALPALRTGWWIRGYELSRGCRIRAKALWCFYLADALWLAAASAFLTLIALVIISDVMGIQPDMTRFATVMLTIAGGVSLTTAIGFYATYYAWRYSIRVWIHPKTYQWTGGNETKLSQLVFQPARLNHGVFILGTSLALPGLIVGTALLIALIGGGERLNPVVDGIAIAVMLLFFVVVPLLSIVAYIAIAGFVLATNPSDCWNGERE